MWRRLGVLLFILVIILAIVPASALAQSLSVSPGELKAENIPLGEKVSLTKMAISNKTDASHVYSISVEKPISLRQGYEAIADPHWINADRSEIEIAAQSAELVEIWVKIPNEESNANKHYEGWVMVAQKPAAGEVLGIAVAVRILLSTSGYTLPANIWLAIGHRVTSFFSANAPVSYYVLYALAAILVIFLIWRFSPIRLSRR